MDAEQSSRPDVDPEHRHLMERLYRRRYLGVVALAGCALLLQRFPLWVPVAILVAGTAANLLGHRASRHHDRMPLWVHLVDLTACLTFPAVLPETTLAAVAVMMAAVCLAACISGMRNTLVLIAYGTAVLGVLGYAGELPDASIAIVAFAVSGFMIATTVAPLASAEALVRRRLDATIHNLDAIVWLQAVSDDHLSFVNERATTALGWPVASWLAPGFWEGRIHPDDASRVLGLRERSLALGIDHEQTYRFRTGDERWVHLHDRVSVVVDDVGQASALQGMSMDVTARIRAEQRVGQHAEIVERIDLALLILRRDEQEPDVLRLVAANAAAEALVGRSLTSVIGRTLEEAFPVLAGSRLGARLGAVIERSAPLRIDDLIVQPVGASPRVVSLRAFPLSDRSVGLSLQDVTEAVTAAEALRREALYDGLTGLPNRRLLDEELHRAVRETPVTGEQVALLMMDLDQFKEVNDALGHQVGDKLLREIGARLDRTVADALVARLGGDEFAVVLVGHVDEHRARTMAETIRAALAEPFLIDDVRLQSNASIGIALFPGHALEVATLIQRADVAMYVAKRSGTGIAVYSAENDRSSVERLTLIGELPDAVADGELELHYQPFVDLRTGEVVRAEALVRWNHPRLGLLGPERFVELAELSGAIQPLTRWVVQEGLRAMAGWQADGHAVGLAVNLSVRNLYDPYLVLHLATQLAASGASPEDLVVELTESELMDDPSLAREVFTALGALGVRTAIDDFGTGYSSLTYLRDLPLQEIKVDRSFVSGLHHDSDEFTIVRSMVDLGHNLGLEVVAEGVEHADDLDLLHRLGCDLAQGFHISRPLPLPAFLAWLADRPALEGLDRRLLVRSEDDRRGARGRGTDRRDAAPASLGTE